MAKRSERLNFENNGVPSHSAGMLTSLACGIQRVESSTFEIWKRRIISNRGASIRRHV